MKNWERSQLGLLLCLHGEKKKKPQISSQTLTQSFLNVPVL